MAWRQSNRTSKMRSRLLNWPDIGPLRRDIDRLFANLIYQDTSSPLPLTIWHNEGVIFILAEAYHLGSKELDITVTDRSLLLSFSETLDNTETETYVLPQTFNDSLHTYIVNLPYPIDGKQIEANFDDDLLYIRLLRLKERESEEDMVRYCQ